MVPLHCVQSHIVSQCQARALAKEHFPLEPVLEPVALLHFEALRQLLPRPQLYHVFNHICIHLLHPFCAKNYGDLGFGPLQPLATPQNKRGARKFRFSRQILDCDYDNVA